MSIPDLSVLEKGDVFDFGIFHNVVFQHIEGKNLFFKDKFCNVRKVLSSDVKMMGIIKHKGSDLVEKKDEPVETKQPVKKEGKEKVPAKADKVEKEEKPAPVKKEKKQGTLPVAKKINVDDFKVEAGWVPLSVASKKYNITVARLYYYGYRVKSIEIKKFTGGDREANFVNEKQVADLVKTASKK